MTFEQRALDLPSQIMKADDTETIVMQWIDMAIREVKETTGEELDSTMLLGDLSDRDWIFMVQNQEDDEDETDYIDLQLLGEQLDNILRWLTEDLDDDEPDWINGAPNYEKFQALGMTTEETLVWLNID